MHLHCVIIISAFYFYYLYCYCCLTLTFIIIINYFYYTPPVYIIINIINCCCCFSAAAIIFHHKIGTFAAFSLPVLLYCCFYTRSHATGLLKTLNNFSRINIFVLSNNCTLISRVVETWTFFLKQLRTSTSTWRSITP